MRFQVLVLAKAPRPGQVKTRLCPPCTPQQAAAVALAALDDTLDAVDGLASAARRHLVLEGDPADSICGPAWPRDGWELSPQRGASLGERIVAAFGDTSADGLATVLIGMDTPQVTPRVLAHCVGQLATADAVLGPASDGGWWLLGLRDPNAALPLATVATSRPDTGANTRAALAGAGLRVLRGPELRDVDTVEDARRVAPQCPPDGRFVAAVSRHVPPVPARPEVPA